MILPSLIILWVGMKPKWIFVEIQNANNLAGITFDTSPALVNDGRLSASWSGVATTLANNTILYSVCFEATGSAGNNVSVDVTSDPVAQLVAADDGMGGTVNPVLNPSSGNVEIIGSGGFQFIATDSLAQTGDTICMPINVRGFNRVISLQFGLEWDTSVIKLVELKNDVLPPSQFGGVDQQSDSTASFLWVDDSLVGQTLSNDTTIYGLRFEVVGPMGTSSPLHFTTIPGTVNEIEVVAKNSMGQEEEIPFILIDGSVTVPNNNLAISADVTDVPCHGDATGAIDVTLANGSGNYSFEWQDGNMDEDRIGLEAGTYTVTVTDNDNSNTVEGMFTISEPDTLTLSLVGTDATCSGNTDGLVDVTVNGGTSPYSYDWNDDNLDGTEDPTDLAAGTYTLTVTDDNTCTAIGSITIAAPDSIGATFVITPVSCNGDEDGTIDLTPTGGDGNYTFDWSDNRFDGMEDAVGIGAGSKVVRIMDGSGCLGIIIVDVPEPVALEITNNTTSVDASCPGSSDGSIHLTLQEVMVEIPTLGVHQDLAMSVPFLTFQPAHIV